MSEALELKTNPAYNADLIAKDIADTWVRWNSNRDTWLVEKKELREYLFATDTRKTSNSKLPWKNSTVTPKLTQLRDNLHANYIAALFPSEDWFIWEAGDKSSAMAEKRQTILNYMKNKVKASGFEVTVSQLVLDYIDYGNVFVGHEYVNLEKKDPLTGEVLTMYRGPRAYRISPLDVVFDPLAPSFDRSPLIVRTLKSVADLYKDIKTKPHLGYDMAVFGKALDLRHKEGSGDLIEQIKADGLIVDGFGSLEEYLDSNMVEILEFHGDYYDCWKKEYYSDMTITVIDRRWILKQAANPSWLGKRPIFHCGWRLRPDNLWAQGPLDQLVGMQYRIDHLENLKADVFDQIAHPVTVIKGETVEDFVFAPGVQIHCGADGDVLFPRPDGTALNADMQINDLMNKMEELAGAPRQAMGIRTPGEKTKYEVQVLENGAGRIFSNKAGWFEKNIVEPLLNSMLEESVRSMGDSEVIRTVDPDIGTEEFTTITKKDIQAKGMLYPIGARHFAEQARFVQELSQTLVTVEQLPAVKAHISGKGVARALENALGWKPYNIVQDNIAVAEQLETQRLINAGQEALDVESAVPSELQSGDMEVPDEEQPSQE
jgi:hypothetical protein